MWDMYDPDHRITFTETELLWLRQELLSLYNAAYRRGEATERYKAILARIDQELPPGLRVARP